MSALPTMIVATIIVSVTPIQIANGAASKPASKRKIQKIKFGLLKNQKIK